MRQERERPVDFDSPLSWFKRRRFIISGAGVFSIFFLGLWLGPRIDPYLGVGADPPPALTAKDITDPILQKLDEIQQRTQKLATLDDLADFADGLDRGNEGAHLASNENGRPVPLYVPNPLPNPRRPHGR